MVVGAATEVGTSIAMVVGTGLGAGLGYWFVHCLDDLFDHWFDHFIVVPQMVRHSGVYAIIAWMLWHAPGHLCPRVSMPSSTQVMVLRSHLISNT